MVEGGGLEDTRPGALFLVGDPKQSIYRFRRADIELFDRIGDQVGERVVLHTNFRSVPGILDFVNVVFSDLFGEHPGPGQAAHHDLDGSRDGLPAKVPRRRGTRQRATPTQLDVDRFRRRRSAGPDAAPAKARKPRGPVPVVALGRPAGHHRVGRTPQGDDRRRRRHGRHRGALARPRSRRTDPARRVGPTSPFSYRRVPLWLRWKRRSKTPRSPTASKGRRCCGTPTRCATSSPCCAPSTIRPTPCRSWPRCGHLDSACGDDDLVTWHHQGGRWDPRAAVPDDLAGHPVAVAMAVLDRLHRQRWWSDPSAMVAPDHDRSAQLRVGRRTPAASRPLAPAPVAV